MNERKVIAQTVLWGVLALNAAGLGVVACSQQPSPPPVVSTVPPETGAEVPYGWFRDMAGAYKARINQIAAHKRAMAQIPVTNLIELKLWRDELDSMRHSCRVIAAHYNANAAGANQNFFTSPAVPPLLIIEGCEA